MGRIDSASIFSDRDVLYPSGYIFWVSPDGKWKLLSKKHSHQPKLLATGTIKLDTLKWHHIELNFHGSLITAVFDGKELGKISDDSHTEGMIGLGTGWNSGQFDNLSVSPN